MGVEMVKIIILISVLAIISLCAARSSWTHRDNDLAISGK